MRWGAAVIHTYLGGKALYIISIFLYIKIIYKLIIPIMLQNNKWDYWGKSQKSKGKQPTS